MRGSVRVARVSATASAMSASDGAQRASWRTMARSSASDWWSSRTSSKRSSRASESAPVATNSAGFCAAPTAKPGAQYQFNADRVKHWLSMGAQPSETAANLLKKVGIDPTPGKKS